MYEDETGRRNAEGYSDPTAYKGAKRAERDVRAEEFRRSVYKLAKVCGVYIEIARCETKRGVN